MALFSIRADLERSWYKLAEENVRAKEELDSKVAQLKLFRCVTKL